MDFGDILKKLTDLAAMGPGGWIAGGLALVVALIIFVLWKKSEADRQVEEDKKKAGEKTGDEALDGAKKAEEARKERDDFLGRK